MAFARASVFRGALRAARAPTTSAARPQVLRQVARRGYASGGHGAQKAGGDLPWMIGAVAVTAPTCWWLLQNGPEAHHDDHGHGHDEGHAEEHKEESKEDSEAATESKDTDKDSEKSDDSDSGDEGKGADTPDTSDDEKEDSKDDSKDESKDDSKKSSTKDVPETPQGTKDTHPSKGANRTRTESDNGKKQGKPEDTVVEGNEKPNDKPAASKPANDSKNTQTGKQEGLSNTDTKHSTDLTNNPDKSRKGEGSPETAKLKGTVDPKRPTPEMNKGPEKKENKAEEDK